MPRIVVGLDFGTSSTSVSYADLDGDKTVKTVPLETSDDGKTTYNTMPSAMFYIPDQNRLLVGRKAINAYVNREYEGRLLRNLKSVLDDVDATTKISDTKNISYFQFIYTFLKAVKARVITETGTDNIVGIVVGRPVHFFDNADDRDNKAEQNLRRIVEKLGFENIVFLEEPIAASFSLETKIPTDTTAFVADIGGGTSDFAAIALGPSHREQSDRTKDVFATAGIKIGGTDFDKSFSLREFMPELGFETKVTLGNNSTAFFPRKYFDMLSNAFSINDLYNYRIIDEVERLYQTSLSRPRIGDLLHIIKTESGHTLITEVETCKKGLSYVPIYTFRRQKAFNLNDDLFMTEQDLETAISKFNENTTKYLTNTNKPKLLNDIISELTDYKNQYVKGNQEYDILFGQKETDTILQCKKQIDNIVYTTLEQWATKISSISLDDIKKEFTKYQTDINKANLIKIRDNLNRFREIGQFEIAFEPDYSKGYEVFDKLLNLHLPEDRIKGILETSKEDILKNIKYKEALLSKIYAELDDKTRRMIRKDLQDLYHYRDNNIIGFLSEQYHENRPVLSDHSYNEKLQQRTFAEYKNQKGLKAFIKNEQEVIEAMYKATITRFITSIKKRIFIECKHLNETDVLLNNIKNLIHAIELSMFEIPGVNVLTEKAIEAGAIYTDKIIQKVEFEQAIDEHIPKLKASINECIKKSGKDKSDFEYLIMTGGSSRVPMVRKSIQECFDKDIKVVCEDLSDQKNADDHEVMENIDTPDDISVGLCRYAMKVFK